MFRIGEFSKLTQVSIRMLRYYDEVGLLKPAEVDKWTGHRMYSVTQIPRLNRILYLRDSGFLVSEIALALEMNDRLLLETLEKKRLEIEQTIQNEQEKIRKIAIAKSEIQENKGELHYNISIKAIPAVSYTHLDVYKRQEMSRLYHQYICSSPLDYVSDLLFSLGFADYQELAVEFFAPMFLLYSVYDGSTNKEEIKKLLKNHLEKMRFRLESGSKN